jgi:hypothetical protein
MTRPGELASAWRAAGFAVVRETMLVIRMEFASFNDYWAPYVGKDGPGAEYVATIDAMQRERLRELVRAAYLDGEPDGPRSYAATAWAVKGQVPKQIKPTGSGPRLLEFYEGIGMTGSPPAGHNDAMELSLFTIRSRTGAMPRAIRGMGESANLSVI